MSIAPSPRLRRARLGVFGTFFACGFGFAAWLVAIPAVQQRTGVSHAVLGGLIMVLGLGGVLGMQVAGLFIHRFGSKVVSLASLALFVVALNLPWSAPMWVVAVALLLFGLGNGALDVSMNDQAVIVERGYGRPIMSAFHALWSVGGATGALLGATTQTLGASVRVSVLVTSVVAAAIGAWSVAQMLPTPTATENGGEGAASSASGPARLSSDARTKAIVFGALAFLIMLSEGVANDWSALHAVEELGASEGVGGYAYATFAVAMTVGRLTVDRVAHRYGPAFVVRWGSALAAVGIAVVMASTLLGGIGPALTLVGWALFGLGLAGVVPQLFTAAGNLGEGHQAILLSRVVGAGYVGQLAGPAVIGLVAGWTGLNLAFVLPLLFCLVAVGLARMLQGQSGRKGSVQA